MSEARLRISEIFFSIQGEGRMVGWPTAFVRLTGCPLRCGYCDTTYAFKGGEWMTLPEIIDAVAACGSRYVTVTGGEPLAQRGCAELLKALCDAGHEVSLETSGALDICGLDDRVVRVMDLKTPASGEVEQNRWQNLDCLEERDQVKFVICDRGDYEWARAVVAEHHLESRCEVLFSPAYELQNPASLAEWILQDGLNVRFQLQLHKALWGEERAR